MRVYLAAPWEFKEPIATEADRLAKMGFEIGHHWWEVADTNDNDEKRRQAIHDINGVEKADLVVLYDWKSSSGKATEMGYAMASKKPVVYVQYYEHGNVFKHHPNVLLIHPWELNTVLNTLLYIVRVLH